MATSTKTTPVIKDFDAVAFMRKQRDRISKDIADMDFEEVKEYFAKRKQTGRRATGKR